MGLAQNIALASMGGSGGVLPPPKTITSATLAAWYDMQQASTLTITGGRVAAIADASGSGDANRNLVQATAGNRPTYNVSSALFTGLPTMSLARADPDWLDPVGNWSVSLAQPITIFSVHAVTSLSAQVTYYDDHLVNSKLVLAQTNGGGFFASAGTPLNSGSDNTLNKLVVYCVVFNGASSALYDTAKTAVASGSSGANGSTGLRIGLSGGASSGLQGEFAELEAYVGAMNTTDRATIFGYLGTKWGVTIGP